MSVAMFLIILSYLFHSSESIDGAIGFHVNFDESGEEFQKFGKILATTFRDYSASLEQYVVVKENLTYIENAFAMTSRTESRIPRILEELKSGPCFLKDRLFPTLGVTRWKMPEFNEISVSVDGGELHDYLAGVLRRNGLYSYPAEYDRKKSEMFSPRRIILARIPRVVPFPNLPITWKTFSDVKVNAKVAVFKCDSNWQKSDCTAVEWVKFEC